MRFLEEAPAKGLPQCAAISPGVKGRGLRCPRPPWEIKAIGSYDSASRHQLRFIYGRDKRGRSREKRQECRFPERLRQARPLAVAVERGEIRRVSYQLED